jgi:hypothetical protein
MQHTNDLKFDLALPVPEVTTLVSRDGKKIKIKILSFDKRTIFESCQRSLSNLLLQRVAGSREPPAPAS